MNEQTPLPPNEVCPMLVRQLSLDRRYNRPLDKRMVRKIAREWDTRRAQTLAVNMRDDGSCVVMDGQHRLEAAKLVGVNELNCEMFHLSYREEALMFAWLNRERKVVSPTNIFHAEVEGGEAGATEIKAIAERHGFTIQGAGGFVSDSTINAISCLYWVYRGAGEQGRNSPALPHPELVDRMLRTLRQVWDSDERRTNGQLLKGLGHFLRLYPEASEAVLVKHLNAHASPDILIRKSIETSLRTGSHRHVHISIHIWAVYNKGLMARKLENRYGVGGGN